MQTYANILATTMGCLLWLGLLSPAYAADPAADTVRDVAEKMITAISKDMEALKANQERLRALVDANIVPRFDFANINRWVLGKHWQSSTKQQQQRFAEEFKTLLLNTYTKMLWEYSNQEIIYHPTKISKDKKWHIVNTEIRSPNADPVPVQYRMRERDGDWKISDLVVDGISMVKTYRQSFLPEIDKIGLEQLINKLGEKNAQFSQNGL